MKKILISVTLSLLCVVAVAQDSLAAGVHTLTVAPSITDISVDPGATVTKRVTVANQGEKDFTLQLRASPYSVINEQYETTFEPVEARLPVDKWIQFDAPARNELTSGKYLDVNMSISVPKDIPPGGYSAVLLIESSISQEKTSGIVAKNRVAHIVYINVNGSVERNGVVKTSSLPFIAFSGEQQIRHTVSNLGGANEKTKVDTLVKDIFGRPIFGQMVEKYVLPGTKRVIDTSWDGSAVFGIYSVTLSSEIAGKDSSQSPHWMIVIHPLFLLVAILIIGASIWFRLGRAVSIKRLRKKP